MECYVKNIGYFIFGIISIVFAIFLLIKEYNTDFKETTFAIRIKIYSSAILSIILGLTLLYNSFC